MPTPIDISKIFTQLRRNMTISVIGAGPAGIAIIGKLLDLHLQCQKDSYLNFGSESGVNWKIFWIDKCFDAGRLSLYKPVPSNTKVKFFMNYAQAFQSFQAYHERLDKNGLLDQSWIPHLSNLDPEKGCQLEVAHKMCSLLTNAIVNDTYSPLVTVVGNVQKLEYNATQCKWQLHTQSTSTAFQLDDPLISSDLVFLATGSYPKEFEYPISENTEIISLDTAMCPIKLAQRITGSDHIALFGSSHSAMLALKNLTELNVPPFKITQFHRSEFKYAKFMENDWILYDNTGLKGLVADWTKQYVDVNYTASGKCEIGCLQRILLKKESDGSTSEMDASISKVIAAIGFKRNALPQIIICGKEISDINHDPLSAKILYSLGETTTMKIAPALYGYGIAFPERVTDPLGNVEEAVGLWKFAKYINRTLPESIPLEPDFQLPYQAIENL